MNTGKFPDAVICSGELIQRFGVWLQITLLSINQRPSNHATTFCKKCGLFASPTRKVTGMFPLSMMSGI